MKYIRNTMQRPNQWTVVHVKNGQEHFVGTYATEAEAQEAAWPTWNSQRIDGYDRDDLGLSNDY